ncbi:Malate dehydrogenase [Phytophthora nicotianae]|uniref:histidine kinase n=1 Tax=Phytophthora nicotianae TaxID=4792 RepID=A0A0W8DQW1_PHYNI|nr:Malate dehydrogenase [Phytophthora nicotianae]
MGVVAIGQDVTERNTKEMEYRKLIETANAPIFGVDTEGRVVIFNAKASQISEYSPDEVMGVDLVETLISEEFRPAVAAVFQSAFQGTETANFEFPLVTKTGRKVEILLNATPRYDHTGKLVGVVGIGQDITDRIIQEKEYSRLIDTANAPIFGVDCNYEVIIWNKKAAAITEYTNEDTIGQELFKFISEDYRDAVAKVFSKALEGKGTANFDFPLITKSGRRLDILLNATPKYDHFGNICGAVGIGQDITDRRAQEQEYTRLIDTANAPIFGVDANGCVNIWNKKAADTTQYPNEEVLGANLVENFIPEDFREAVWTVLSQALEGQETANFEFPLITKDGRRVEILLNATPRYNEKGVVIGVVGIGQDITIRMAQEKETNRLIHSANAPIFGVDRDGLVNIWNLKAAEITQYSAEEVMGKDLVNRFVAEEHRATVELELQRALEGEQTNNFDFPLITKTGRRVEILLNATPRYDELGQIFGVVGIGQDITERIAQEQELIRLIDTANARFLESTPKGRDTGGAIVDIPDWKQINKTSATLPNMKDKPLEGAETADHVSSHSNPTLWSHPPFMGSKKDSAPASTSSQQPMSPNSVSKSARSRAVTEGGQNANAPLSLQRFDSDKSYDEHLAGDPIAAMLERLNISSPAARNGVRGLPSVDHASATTESDAAVRGTMDPSSIVIPEGDPVDYSLGVQQCGGHEELFLSLLEKFTVSCEAIMSRVLAAYEQGDITVTRRESHSLKGSSAYVAAMRVSKAAFRVQVACEQLQQCQSEIGTGQQPAALADAAAMLSLKQSLDDSITLLKKEHRHLRGYLRRNFEFRDLTRSGNASSAAALRAQNSSQDRANGPCGIM